MNRINNKIRQEQMYREIASLTEAIPAAGKAMRADELLDWISTSYPELCHGGTHNVLRAARHRSKYDDEDALEYVFIGSNSRPLLN